MTDPFQDQVELRELLDALCDQSLRPEQMRRLEELMQAHPEAEAYYVQYMSLQANLTQHFAVPSMTERSVRSPLTGKAADAAAPARRQFRTAAGWSALAAGLLLGALLFWPRTGAHEGVTVPEAERLDNSVAVLLRAPGAVWDASEPAPRVGVPLHPGRLRLKSGGAHLEFYSGASVILQGPAEFLLLSANEGYCARGKLRATVPPQAQGFRIGTPQLDVVDRGTEFGLEIKDDDKTEVHVFQGKVELYDAGAGPAAAARQELTTGQALRMSHPGQVSSIPVDPAAFSTARDLAERQRKQIQRRQDDWLAASEALRHDPGLLVYYTFQDNQTWSRVLQNQVRDGRQGHDGAIVGCLGMAGRWPGKQALDFKQVSDRVRFHVPGQLESLTLAAWVRVDALPNRWNSLMMTDGWDDCEPHWHISDQGVLELGVQGYKRKGGAHYYSPSVITSARFGEWVYLAVVYDRGERRQVTHYVNGLPVSQKAIVLDVPLRLADVELGNWHIADNWHHNSPIRYFSGCMDEFMLFSRALRNDEIMRLFTQGQPPQ